ncbi:hypothetical protein D3C71_513380 [compost metagenome]
MRVDALGQRQLGRHQECGPINRVEANDVLADDVRIRRPKFRPWSVLVGQKTGCGHVIGQCVDPDIHDMFRIVGNLHTPVEGRARDRKILQPGFDEGDDFVATLSRADEVGLFLVKLQQPILIGRKLEEVARFLDPLDRRPLPAVTHAVANFRLVLGVIGFVTHRIPAGIAVLVDVAIVGHPVPHDLARLMMAQLGGADEIVVRGVEYPAHGAEFIGIALRQLFRRNAFLACGLLHLLAMFVSTGQEEDVFSIKALEARHGIGRDKFVGMADMRLAVRIGNRGGDVERRLVGHRYTRKMVFRGTAARVMPLLAHVCLMRNPNFLMGAFNGRSSGRFCRFQDRQKRLFLVEIIGGRHSDFLDDLADQLRPPIGNRQLPLQRRATGLFHEILA